MGEITRAAEAAATKARESLDAVGVLEIVDIVDACEIIGLASVGLDINDLNAPERACVRDAAWAVFS